MPSTRGNRLAAIAAALIAIAGGAPAAAQTATTPQPAPLAPGAATTDPFAPAPDDAGVVDADAEEESYGITGGEGDWMARNGLRSPLCPRGQQLACAKSGLIASPAPPGHYSFDIHIDKGLKGNPIAKNIQDATNLIWSSAVSVTAGLFGALEWGFSLDLVAETAPTLSPQLSAISRQWTVPIAALALLVGAIWFAVNALGRGALGASTNRVLGGLSIFGLSLIVLANPVGTVGWLNTQAGEIGRAAITSTTYDVNGGNSSGSAINGGLEDLWAGVVTEPYALLEFGDVRWGTDPAKLDPDLKAAATKIAREQSASRQRAVRNAKTNADLFLVWPSNKDERNGITEGKCEGTDCLLRVLCQTDDDNECEGDNRARAHQRNESGTGARFGMVFLITLGLLPFWLLLGVIVYGTLSAAVLVLWHLLMLAVRAPFALTFGWWGGVPAVTRVFGALGEALAAKVIYGLAAGLTMTVYSLLSALDGLGWVVKAILTFVAMVALFKRRKEFTGAVASAGSPKQVIKHTRRHTSRATDLARERLGGDRGAAAQPRTRVLGDAGAVPFAGPAAKKAGSAGLAARAGRVPGVGAHLAGAVKGAGAAGALAKVAAPTDGKAKLAALGGGLVAGPVGAAAATMALSGWRARAHTNARRMSAIRDGERLPERLRPAEQVQALLGGRAAAAAAAKRSADRRRPQLEHRQGVLQRERRAALEQLGALPAGDPRRQDLERRVASLDGRLGGVNRELDTAGQADIFAAAARRSRNPDGTFTAEAQQRMGGWLDRQAEASAEQRDYSRLAQLRHITPSEYGQLPAAERADLHRDIDRQLQQRAPEPAAPAPNHPPRPRRRPPAPHSDPFARLAERRAGTLRRPMR